jgi:xanthine dehydrogenase YagS FAD-binding subunit
VSVGAIADIPPGGGLDLIAWRHDGTLRIGALVTVATIATDDRIALAYPGLAAAAGSLATPQIRAVATIGGNLLQRTRCWYYRSAEVGCLKKGGDTCPARTGNHLYGVCFDRGPCVWPHPSTLGAALLAYEATIETEPDGRMSAAALFGDGHDGRRDNCLAPGVLLTGVTLPVPVSGERAAYYRAISRARAEWPLVEAVVRVVLSGDRIVLARVAAGGVAPVPLRLGTVEAILEGGFASADTVAAAAAAASHGATPLPQTGYKTALLTATVEHTLLAALGIPV